MIDGIKAQLVPVLVVTPGWLKSRLLLGLLAKMKHIIIGQGKAGALQ